MGIFDFITAAQTDATEKTEALQKTMEDVVAKLYSGQTATTKKKPTARNKKKRKRTAPKPDLSIEGISKQIIKQRDNIRKNGFKHYEFMANKNCCEVCAALNGRHFPISKLVIGVNAPPMHDGCRCSITAYENETEYQAWLDNLGKGGSTKQWEATKKKKR